MRARVRSKASIHEAIRRKQAEAKAILNRGKLRYEAREIALQQLIEEDKQKLKEEKKTSKELKKTNEQTPNS